MMSRSAEQRGQARYGDYPELFWDLKPEAPIDVSRPSILARVLQGASLQTIRQLVPLSLLRRELPTLPVPEHTRLFWTRVVELLDEKEHGGPPARARA